MESENVFNTLAIDSFTDQNLVIAVVNFLAAHNTDVPQILALISEFSESLSRNIRSSNVNVLQKFKLSRNELGTCIINFRATKEIQLVNIFEFFELGNTIVCYVTAFSE